MMNNRVLALLVGCALLGGCVNLYQYQSRGQLSFAENDRRDAVLFWHKDEGRLWYGKKYEQLETSLGLRICNETPKHFSLGERGHVELLSRGGDLRIAAIGADGELEPLQPGERLPAGETCGLVRVGGEAVGTDRLSENSRPQVVILCRNRTRYPLARVYPFEPVTRVEIDKDERPAPDPCR